MKTYKYVGIITLRCSPEFYFWKFQGEVYMSDAFFPIVPNFYWEVCFDGVDLEPSLVLHWRIHETD